MLVGHNWGWLVGAEMARRRPNLFSKLVILNTNNLPDGEALLERYFCVQYQALTAVLKVLLNIHMVAVPSDKFLVSCIPGRHGPPPATFSPENPDLLPEQWIL